MGESYVTQLRDGSASTNLKTAAPSGFEVRIGYRIGSALQPYHSKGQMNEQITHQRPEIEINDAACILPSVKYRNS